MHPVIAEKVRYGQGSRVFAVLEDGGGLRQVCLGDFETVRYRFNQMACLVGAMLMEQLLSGPDTPSTPDYPPGVWADRVTGHTFATPAEVYALASAGRNEAADVIGARVRMNIWPNGTEALKGVKHLCTSFSQVGDLFFRSADYPVVSIGRAQERSAVKKVEEAIAHAKRLGVTPYDEPGLRRFMEAYAGGEYLQYLHVVDIS